LYGKIVSGQGSWNKKLITKMIMPKGKREFVFENKLTPLIKAANFDFRSDSKYYIINQTISTDDIDFSISKKSKLDVGVETELKKLEAEGKIAISANTLYELKQRFDQPHRVFYTVLEISSNGPLSAGNRDFLLLPVENNIPDPPLVDK
jgi:hypothetical protein